MAPVIPNGIVLSYTITVSFRNTSAPLEIVVGPTAGGGYVVSGLLPYQTVDLSVAASTAIGTGPSAMLTATTDQYGKCNTGLVPWHLQQYYPFSPQLQAVFHL